MNDLVSVIIPTYNRSFDILKRAVDSVLAQNYKNFEIIIIDDNTDGNVYRNDIENKIKSVSNKIKYIKHDKNRGACAARNTGINHSNGNYIAFLDDDDEWLPMKLEIQISKFQDSQVGLVYCNAYTIITNNGVQISKKVRSYKIHGWVFDKLIVENFIGSTSFVVIRKEVLKTCGYFNTNMKSAQDYELWLRISKNYKIDLVNIPLVNYYVHEGERISRNIDFKIDGLESLNEINMDYLSRNARALSIRRLKIVPYYNIKFGHKEALLKWFEAVKICPFQITAIKYLIKILVRISRSKRYDS